MNIHLEDRDSLYYSTFTYTVSLEFEAATVFRQSMGPVTTQNLRGRVDSWISKRLQYNPDDTTDFDAIFLDCARLLTLLENKHYRLRIERSRMDIYTNDQDLIAQLERNFEVWHIKKANVICDKNYVYLQAPNIKHKYRTFLKSGRIQKNKEKLYRIFQANKDDIRLCPSLAHFFAALDPALQLQRPWNKYYYDLKPFLDHDNSSIPTLINLTVPGIVNQTKEILAK